MRFLLFCLLLAVSGSNLFAALEWETNLVELKAQPGDDSVSAIYRYNNTGTGPLKITRVINSCGCTSSLVDKGAIQPGATGELTAVFKVGSRRGLQKKTFKVLTDDGETMLLGLWVNIEETVSMDYSILFWKHGEPAETRTITLDVLRPEPLVITTAEASDPSLKVNLETVKPGRRYRVHITPSVMDNPLSATVNILAAEPADSPQTFIARVRIR